MKPEIVIWGGGSQARAIAPIVAAAGSSVVAIVDDTPDLPSPFPDVPIHQGIEAFRRWLAGRDVSRMGFAIAIGNPHGAVRLKLHDLLIGEGMTPASIVHPSAVVAADADLSAGCQVFAGAVIASAVRMGRQCIVNSMALVEHDVVLGDAVEVSPGATVLGLTHIGAFGFVGAGATVLSRLSIGSRVSIAAGAVAAENVPDGALVSGTTSRVL